MDSFEGFAPIDDRLSFKWILLRRLFSTFAGGAPGAGLLLMRLVSGSALITYGIAGFLEGHSIKSELFDMLAFGDGALLVAGLWTPISGSLAVILALRNILAQHANLSSNILLATIGTALALLGPGAWSVDARLFGWKRIDIQRR